MRTIAFATDNAQFCRILPFTLKEEGGKSNDAHDPGGATNQGIIQREYNAYRALKKLPQRHVFDAADAEIDEIYFTSYFQPWTPRMPIGVDLDFFDNSVNEGPTQAVRLVQRALGVANVDGHIGTVTLAALQAQTSTADQTILLLEKYRAARAAYYESLRTFRYFGKGWIGRDSRITSAAESMVRQARVVA